MKGYSWSSPSGAVHRTRYLHDEAGGRLPLEEQLLLPLVSAQELLPGAHGVTAVDDYKDVGIGSSSKDITGVEGDLIRDNWEGEQRARPGVAGRKQETP